MGKHKRFVDLSRSRRADLVIGLRNDIRRCKGIYGGRFCADTYFNDEADEAFAQDFDFLFPSARDRFILWNADITTATFQFHQEVTVLARQEAKAMLTQAELAEWEMRVEPPQVTSAPGGTMSFLQQMLDSQEIPFGSFEGRTMREQRKHLERIIADERPPEIREKFAVDKSYRHGIGLSIVIDEPRIDRETIERTIDRFVAGGEVEWVAANAVPRDRLQYRADRSLWHSARAVRLEPA